LDNKGKDKEMKDTDMKIKGLSPSTGGHVNPNPEGFDIAKHLDMIDNLIREQAPTKLKSMNIYLLEQKENTGYNTFSSCIVIAENEEKAKEIHPASNSENIIIESNEWYIDEDLLKKHFPDIKERINHLSLAFGWVGYADRNKITVKKLGVSNVEKHGVILSSYHAG